MNLDLAVLSSRRSAHSFSGNPGIESLSVVAPIH